MDLSLMRSTHHYLSQGMIYGQARQSFAWVSHVRSAGHCIFSSCCIVLSWTCLSLNISFLGVFEILDFSYDSWNWWQFRACRLSTWTSRVLTAWPPAISLGFLPFNFSTVLIVLSIVISLNWPRLMAVIFIIYCSSFAAWLILDPADQFFHCSTCQ